MVALVARITCLECHPSSEFLNVLLGATVIVGGVFQTTSIALELAGNPITPVVIVVDRLRLFELSEMHGG